MRPKSLDYTYTVAYSLHTNMYTHTQNKFLGFFVLFCVGFCFVFLTNKLAAPEGEALTVV